MTKILVIFAAVIGLTFGAPVDEPSAVAVESESSNDLLRESDLSLNKLANVLMSPHISDNLDQSLEKMSTLSELKANAMSDLNLDGAGSHHELTQSLQLPQMNFKSTGSLSAPAIGIKTTPTAGLSISGAVGHHSSHLLEASKDSFIGAAKMPFEVSAETQAIGGAVPAAAAVKGSAVSSAIATPIIVKAVALPGLAAAKTAGLMASPYLLFQNLHSVPEMLSQRVKASVDGLSGHIGTIGGSVGDHSAFRFPQLLVIENPDQLETEGSLAFDKESKHLENAVGVLKAGAVGLKAGVVGLKAKTVGLAAKGLLVAKKGVYTAGRIIMKPIALIAGAHLKMLGSGLTLGGKLIGGTGAGIAKAGTAIKYAGLGGIGVGASAVSWGFDKSTFGSHLAHDFEARAEANTAIDN